MIFNAMKFCSRLILCDSDSDSDSDIDDSDSDSDDDSRRNAFLDEFEPKWKCLDVSYKVIIIVIVIVIFNEDCSKLITIIILI